MFLLNSHLDHGLSPLSSLYSTAAFLFESTFVDLLQGAQANRSTWLAGPTWSLSAVSRPFLQTCL